MNALQKIAYHLPRKDLPLFKAGDVVRVHCKIQEGEKERIQIFEGVVIKIRNNGISSSFTVRKVSYGIGVQRIFPYYAPTVDRVELVTSGRVRRAKLYYLRNLIGKKARISEEQKAILVPEVKKEEVIENAATPQTEQSSS